MKTLSKQSPTLFGIILLAAVMVFSFASCQNEPDPGNDPQIPAALQNTEWTHTSGDKISLTKDSVTITPNNGQAQTFKLKDTSSISQNGIEQTILFFKDKQSPDDTITYRDGSITMVNFSIINTPNRANGWSKVNNNNNGYGTYGDFHYNYTPSEVTIYAYSGNGGNVIIPETINGKPITKIGHRMFESSQLTSITIPNSVTSIESYAFLNNQLTSVTIPNSITYIDYGVFQNNQLTNVTIPNSVTSIGDDAFAGNRLTSVTIGNSVTHIANAVFANNQLTSVTIPNNVVSIWGRAFENNPLTSITIGSNVSIDNYTFTYSFKYVYERNNRAAGTYILNINSQSWIKQ
jgi:hypothetical protein